MEIKDSLEMMKLESALKVGKIYSINLYNCKKIIKEDLLKTLNELPKFLGLTPFPETIKIKQFKTPTGEKSYSGNILFSESHLNFHSWNENKFVRFELSSCKEIDFKVFRDCLKEIFKPKKIEISWCNWRN